MSCAAQSKNLALFLDADLAFMGNQSFAGISIHNCLDTRFAKSSCISRSTILRRYRSFCFSNAASSIFGVSNAAAEFSRNSFFQRLIITGDSSCFAASSLSVYSSRAVQVCEEIYSQITNKFPPNNQIALLVSFPIQLRRTIHFDRIRCPGFMDEESLPAG